MNGVHSDVGLCIGIPYKKDDADRYYLEVHAEEEQVLKQKLSFFYFIKAIIVLS